MALHRRFSRALSAFSQIESHGFKSRADFVFTQVKFRARRKSVVGTAIYQTMCRKAFEPFVTRGLVFIEVHRNIETNVHLSRSPGNLTNEVSNICNQCNAFRGLLCRLKTVTSDPDCSLMFYTSSLSLRKQFWHKKSFSCASASGLGTFRKVALPRSLTGGKFRWILIFRLCRFE